MKIKRVAPTITKNDYANVAEMLEDKPVGLYLFSNYPGTQEFIVFYSDDITTSYDAYTDGENSLSSGMGELKEWLGVYEGEVILSVVDKSLPPV